MAKLSDKITMGKFSTSKAREAAINRRRKEIQEKARDEKAAESKKSKKKGKK